MTLRRMVEPGRYVLIVELPGAVPSPIIPYSLLRAMLLV